MALPVYFFFPPMAKTIFFQALSTFPSWISHPQSPGPSFPILGSYMASALLTDGEDIGSRVKSSRLEQLQNPKAKVVGCYPQDNGEGFIIFPLFRSDI